MNKWTVNINGKLYFSIYFTGEKSTNFNFGALLQGALFKKIKAFVKKNRDLFLAKENVFGAKIADVDVKFKKIMEE